MSNAQIAGELGQNAVENDYLSYAQEDQKEIAQCTNIYCKTKVETQWLGISAGQQASFQTGVLAAMPAYAYESVEELGNLLLNPVETFNALKTLFKNENVLGNVNEALKESYQKRLDNMLSEYQKARTSGAYNAGLEAGKIVMDMATLATGVGGVVKGGVKVTEKTVAKVVNAAKKKVLVLLERERSSK
ncbi:hypothetical protein BHC43_00510 [Snodgrassella alvi]|uniref:hypothetical protein n=1 Tax=Snodgrassella alvi TaxID=1196083 RepID=UPI000C1F0A10|nr:hypothetical protein [Snodgrassella alvi]PIT41688.1 hypothetical protein BHC43_00510 [Snodgrassella alvi]